MATSLQSLAWIAGDWRFSSDDRLVEETWMQPRGGIMLGMSRTVVAGVAREFEFLFLRERDGEIHYVARPSGQLETVFRLVSSRGNEAVFENLDHDFPQRILYRLNPDGSLLAAIEGEVRGNLKRIEFPYQPA